MKPHVEVEYSEITPNIYLGTNLCCDGHAEKLRKIGAKVDMSLEDEKTEIPDMFESFVWLPVEDHFPPTQEQMLVGTGVLREAEEWGFRVYVHCRHGHGRSTTLVIAHLIRSGMTYQEAFDLVRSKRPEIHPTEAQIAFLLKIKKAG